MVNIIKRLIKSFLIVTIPILSSASVLAEDVLIALRAHKGADKALEQWQATADYLSNNIPGYKFILVPFEINSSLNQAVSRGEYHFTLTNPASAVEHKIRYGAQPLATLVNKRQGKGYSKFGSVIFTRADRMDINELKDLKGKIFVGADELGFGGWRVAWFELLKNNINPYRDFKAINFAGGKQQRVVYSVRDGKADAGSVRTDMLERMAASGKIDLNNFKALSQKKTENFPFMHSTELYPEWLFSATKVLADDLKTQVVKTLFSIKSSDMAAIKGKYVNWISPLDYSSVDNLLQELKVGPYQIATLGSFQWIIKEYGAVLTISVLIFILVVSAFVYMVRQNRRIVLSKDKLLREEKKRETLELQLVHSQKIESLGQLTGGIAHDFNNMLASMLGFTELALSSESVTKDKNVSKYLNQVMASGDSAKLLVSQMLAFSRSKAELKDSEILSVSEIINHTYNLLRPLIPRSINIDIKDSDTELYIKTNKVLMEQILMNLCLNSKDSFDDNNGTITVSSDVVTLDQVECNSCHKDVSGKYVVIQIEDTGSGIDKVTKERLFEPFFSTKEVGKGTGMGLSIVHGLVHNHNGHILLESEIGQGTTIKLLLPREYEGTHINPDSYSQKNIDIPDSPAGKHILIIDDEIFITNFLSELLKSKGYTITVKNDSEEALSFFKAHYDKIDVVLTDHTMPKLTGMDMAVKMLEISKNIPIILCTGYSDDVNEEIALANNIRAFLKKPVKSQDLIKTINKLFD